VSSDPDPGRAPANERRPAQPVLFGRTMPSLLLYTRDLLDYLFWKVVRVSLHCCDVGKCRGFHRARERVVATMELAPNDGKRVSDSGSQATGNFFVGLNNARRDLCEFRSIVVSVGEGWNVVDRVHRSLATRA
jgi:hypothetical protein